MKRLLMTFITLAVLGGVISIYVNCQDRLNGSQFNNNNPSGSLSNFGPASVLQHHNSATRNGIYIDAAFTTAASPNLHVDTTFNGTVTGNVYTQPLFIDGNGGQDLVIATTESNHVTALDGATGGVVWDQTLGTPVPLSSLPCGNIDPLGITGTPVIDATTHTLYVDAMTTPDSGTTKKHLIFALSTDDGSIRSGWPVDVSAKVSSGNVSFDSSVQNQRTALLLVNQHLFVGYSGHFGDCGSYHGWVVDVPTANPAGTTAWVTAAAAGGIWAPGGLSSDGTTVFAATGNTEGASSWQQGEAILRFSIPVAFSGITHDYFAPTNWQAMDSADQDIGGSGITLFTVPGATPSSLGIALGKDGNAYLLNPNNLGGIGGDIQTLSVSSSRIITAPAAYTTATATYVVFKNATPVGCPGGTSGTDTMAIKISAANPPVMSVAWCATSNGEGSPIVTTVDGHNQDIVWNIGAEGDNRVHGFNADTGAVIYSGGGANDAMTTVEHFVPLIAAKGRFFAPANGKIYAYTLQ